MPTYEFRLPDGTIIEKIFKMSDVPDSIPNPNGEGEAVRIISGGAGLLFKGTGFYITDYGKDGKKDQRSGANESAASLAKGKAESGGKSESKTDTSKSSSGSAAAGSGSSSGSRREVVPRSPPRATPPSSAALTSITGEASGPGCRPTSNLRFCPQAPDFFPSPSVKA